MEIIIAFVSGVVAVLLVSGVVIAFRTKKQVSNLKTEINDVIRELLDRDRMANQRIDQEIERVDNLNNNLHSYIDSRLDKLENKIALNLGTKKTK